MSKKKDKKTKKKACGKQNERRGRRRKRGQKTYRGPYPKEKPPSTCSSSDISCQASTTTSMKAKENFLTTLNSVLTILP